MDFMLVLMRSFYDNLPVTFSCLKINIHHFNPFMFLSPLYSLVQFIDSYDPPLKGLQEDLNFVSPRIGEVSHILVSVSMI